MDWKIIFVKGSDDNERDEITDNRQSVTRRNQHHDVRKLYKQAGNNLHKRGRERWDWTIKFVRVVQRILHTNHVLAHIINKVTSEGWLCRWSAQSSIAVWTLSTHSSSTYTLTAQRSSWIPGMPGRASRSLRASWYCASCLLELRAVSNFEFTSDFHLILTIQPEFTLNYGSSGSIYSSRLLSPLIETTVVFSWGVSRTLPVKTSKFLAKIPSVTSQQKARSKNVFAELNRLIKSQFPSAVPPFNLRVGFYFWQVFLEQVNFTQVGFIHLIDLAN